jgi:hypothetical protein
VLDLPNIATAREQDVVNHRLVLLSSLLLKITYRLSESANRFAQGVVVTHD